MKQFILSSVVDVSKIITDNPYLSGIAALLLAIFGAMYGDGEVTRAGMFLLVILIAIDWVSGFNAAKKDQIDTSSYGIEGLYRTMVLLLLPAVAHFIDIFFYTYGVVSYFMIAALARHLTKSFIANVHRVGWTQWVPTPTLEALLSWVEDEIAHKDARARRRFEQIHGKEGDE